MLRNLGIKRIEAVQHFNIDGTFKRRDRLLIPFYNFGLIAVLFVACASLLEQFTQVVFIEFYKHSAWPV